LRQLCCPLLFLLSFLILRRPPSSTLFPYTTLFRSLLGLITVLAQWAAQTGEIRMTGRTGERVLYTLRLKIFAQLQRLGLDYYERELTGRIMTRMTTDVDALSTFLQTGLVTAFVSVVTFFGIMVALLVI